jgi:ribose-phosphate pyrophosphokinase
VRQLAPGLANTPVIVVSPDTGGIKRAEAFRQRMETALGTGIPFGFAEKHRSGDVVSGDSFVGDVDGRTVIIVDDLISSGTTMARTAALCRSRGATRVIGVATHGVFAEQANVVLAGDALDTLFVTDSVPPIRVSNPALSAKLACVSVAELFAQAILRLSGDGSLAELAEG